MILLTGGNGFVGTGLLARMRTDNVFAVRVVVRRPIDSLPYETVLAEVGPDTDWSAALNGVTTVLHAAARVHMMQDEAANPLEEYRRVNVAGTMNLARQAAAAGARRFIFVSSIKVNGERTVARRPFTPEDVPAPVDPYGMSKHEAEQQLRDLALRTGMEVVIIRPVLVYGPGVKGNFRTLLRWLQRGVPLPLGAIHNRRSLVALDNLVDLIVTCIRHPAAANQTFLVSDGDDLSTTELLHRAAAALRTRARLIPVPMKALQLTGRLLGRGAMVERLCGSLQVDITKTRESLGWMPPVRVDEALERTARDFLSGAAR